MHTKATTPLTPEHVSITFVMIGGILLSLGFLYSFLIALCFLGFVLLFFRIHFRAKELLVLLSPVMLGILYLAISRSGYNTFISFKYYFGFWAGYLFFVLYRKDISARNLLTVFLVLTLIEVIALNQPWIGVDWRQAVLSGHNPHFVTAYFGFYQRPFGPAFNPTMSSVLGVVLAICCYQSSTSARARASWLVVGLLIPIVYMAATGLIVLLVALVASRRSLYTWVGVSIAFALMFIMLQGLFADVYSKLTFDALRILIDYKIEDFSRYLIFTSDCQRWFGHVACAGTYPLAYDDTGWLPFIFDMGIVGIAFYFLIAAVHVNRLNALPLLLMFVGTWHYPVAFSAVGQFALSGLLLNKIK